ncbi:MAG: DegV family protein [Lachnospiraceae bacterium]|jgi:DegV family protein with EDD domain|nr:DegV family protein [Lachnospiraceae bacterium]
MAVKLVIDSSSDIGKKEAEKLGIHMISMSILFGDKTYMDGVDLSGRDFFEKLIESDELPTTSQINMFQFEECFSELTADGSDVVAVTLSSKLSGTYAGAAAAAGSFPGKVFVVDSLNASLGERILIQYAVRLLKDGASAKELVEKLEDARHRIKLMALLGTLEYLQKGGRISAVTAMSGAILQIKPVIAIMDGEVKMIGKAMGSKKGNNLLIQLIEKSGGIDFQMPYATAYSGMDDSLLQKYLKDSASLWEDELDHIPSYCIGSTIGTHIGPGAIAVAFFAK